MGAALSSIDLSYIVRELQELDGGLIDKTFMDGTNIFMRIYVRGSGKKFLNIGPKYLWTSEKKPGPSSAHGFNEWLRKHFSRAKLASITQVAGQRILKIRLEQKNGEIEETKTTDMYIELFGAGNVIFVNEQGIIEGCLQAQQLQNRTIKSGEQYPIEEKDDLFTINRTTLVEALTKSSEPASKTLAEYAGRKWAIETCLVAGIKSDKATSSREDAERLVAAVETLKNKPTSPRRYSLGAQTKDITPYPLEQLQSSGEPIASMLEGYAHYYEPKVQQDPRDKKLTSLTNRIALQQERQTKLYEKAEKATAQAEMIYQHYQEVAEILTVINSARENFSWKEIKEKLKGHPIIKRIDEKNGHVYVEFEEK